jgi:hypothetical protein
MVGRHIQVIILDKRRRDDLQDIVSLANSKTCYKFRVPSLDNGGEVMRFVWFQLKSYAAAWLRIHRRVSRLVTQPGGFTSQVAISRSFSRLDLRVQFASQTFQ